jgi:hypothetical protein
MRRFSPAAASFSRRGNWRKRSFCSDFLCIIEDASLLDVPKVCFDLASPVNLIQHEGKNGGPRDQDSNTNPFFIGWSNHVGEIIDRSSGLRKGGFRGERGWEGSHKKGDERENNDFRKRSHATKNTHGS